MTNTLCGLICAVVFLLASLRVASKRGVSGFPFPMPPFFSSSDKKFPGCLALYYPSSSCGSIAYSSVSTENHGDVSWVVITPRPPVPASLHLLAIHPVRFESAGASTLHTTTPFGFNQGDAMDRILIDRGVCADYTVICWTILLVSRCSIYSPALACRPFGTPAHWRTVH